MEIEFQTPSLEVVLTSPRIFADDGFRNVVENKGHGLQRAIIFSIIRCYSELITGKGEQKKRTMILAVRGTRAIYAPSRSTYNSAGVFEHMQGW